MKRIETANELNPQEKTTLDKLIIKYEQNQLAWEDRKIVEQLKLRYLLLNFDAAEKEKDEKKRKEVLDTLTKQYLFDLNFDHKKPIKEGLKDEDSLSSQDEDTVKTHTLDDSLLDPRQLQNSFEHILEQSAKKVVESKTKMESSIAKNDLHMIESTK